MTKIESLGRWDLRLCFQQGTGLQMLNILRTQPCNKTFPSASQLLCPKLSWPTELHAQRCQLGSGEAHIYHAKRGVRRKRLNSAGQTGEDRVVGSVIYSLRFIKPCFVPNFKAPPNQGSRQQYCFIFKLKGTGLLCAQLPAPFVCSSKQDVVKTS